MGPAASCRESIGTTEFGLTQVHACLTGTGDTDCQFARSYYTFPDEDAEGGWKHPDGGNDAEAAYACLIGPLNGTNGSGSAHPSLLGQETYRQPLAAALQAALLPAD